METPASIHQIIYWTIVLANLSVQESNKKTVCPYRLRKQFITIEKYLREVS